ncbi:MAG: hypothetical protein ACHQXL_02660 [Candidatus Limnocylindrales bacterium]
MADQLSLSLEPTPIGWPATVQAMGAQPADEPFDDPDTLFEPWWGGERALAYTGRDPEAEAGSESLDLRVLSLDGEILTQLLPEIAELPERIGRRSAILDGTLVAVDAAGRLDDAGLAFLVYDLLALDGRSVVGEPLERRRARLGRLLQPTPSIVLVPMIAGEGRALCAAAAAQGVGWVLARDRRSPYLAGVTSSLWRLIAVKPDEAGPPPEPPAVPASDTNPILALIRRLPLDDPGA